MAVTSTAVFPQAVNSGNTTAASTLATANTNYTAPSNTVTIYTAGANGSDVDHIGVIVYATNTAATVDVFIKNGSNYRFVSSVLVPANTVSTTTAKPAYALPHIDGTVISPSNPLHLISGDALIASTSVTQSTFQVAATGKDY